ncbi:alpha/beta hydrolase [Akkermansiaceae bacterium]|nr:alpha/beta hydrolase [Akkermansiaceae bacterium]MDB4377821.1 alpha/beta hydrolase [Akkermansiaceae bacterium]MDB4412421.1 alpha/beta hydrolase [Akkermansiaceae bacterium]MDB4457983.1 alpha/beta hydrolase [Akkermansiaceae bacterium]
MKSFFMTLVLTASAFSQEWKPLWPTEAPGAAQPPAGTEETGDGLRYRNVEVPQYMLYQPDEPNGQCIVVLPGGGYSIVSGENEGTDIAAWGLSQNITIVVIKYRVGKAELGYQFPVPLLDARRGIRTARAHAAEWKVDPKKIGIMGFSAGGHLASMCATMFDDKFEAETKDAIDALSCRPDFQILGYPVIAMGTKHGHGGSQNNLLGKDISKEEAAKFNTTNRLTKECPPLFFVHSSDDRAVPLRNSMDYSARAAELGIPVTGMVYPTGGHGYGQKGRQAAVGWTDGLDRWLKSLR